MFVKSLIGRHAGSVLNLPVPAAEAGLINGTCVIATDAEIRAAGHVQPAATLSADVFPVGYVPVLDQVGGGYSVSTADGTNVSGVDLFPNLAAARSFAWSYAADAAAAATDDKGSVVIPEGWRDLPYKEKRAIAEALVPGTKSREDIDTVIQAELGQRASAG